MWKLSGGIWISKEEVVIVGKDGWTSLRTYYCPNPDCMIRLNAHDLDSGYCPQCGTSLDLNDPIIKDNDTGLFKNCRIRVRNDLLWKLRLNNHLKKWHGSNRSP